MCQYQRPKQSITLSRHSPSLHISTSIRPFSSYTAATSTASSTTGSIFSTSATYCLSPSPDSPVSKAKLLQQHINLAAQFPESQRKCDTLLGTTNPFVNYKTYT